MKRLATLVLTVGFIVSSLLSTGQGASATPFSDVPANHWAYQALQSLAADGLVEGYPDGKFKGDRPLTRYEMAVLVARVIAKVQANSANFATKADLDKLQKLIDAFKDELDALGVRVTNLEDSLDALDKRTKFAQSIELHGLMLPNVSVRQRTTLPRSIVNTTGAAVTPYYNGANYGGGGAAAAGRTTGIDPFVNAFISTDSSNSAYTQAGSTNTIRYDDRFTFLYHITDNLTVSIPFHLFSQTTGGEFNLGPGSGYRVGIDPGVEVLIAKAGALSNVLIKYGIQDGLKSSRTGLAYKSVDQSQQGPAYENPALPFQKGVSLTGSLNGLTDFQFSFVRIDQNQLSTQPFTTDPLGAAPGFSNYLFNVIPPQIGYVQPGYPGIGGSAFFSNTFVANGSPLGQVFLNRKGITGTVYISQYNGTLYNSSGQIIGGGAIGAPGFTYNDTNNSVVFGSPLPVGSSVTISYSGQTVSNNTVAQRYQINGRINQKFKGLPGAELGVTLNRIYDYDDLQTTGDFTAFQSGPTSGNGLVSNTVFGVDAQLPLGFNLSGANSVPVAFAEYSASKTSADYRNTPSTTDIAGVVGLNLKVSKFSATVQYQTVGAGYLVGAPFKYYGNSPPTFSYWKLPYFPAFFGFGNQLAQNTAFDRQFAGTSGASNTAGNPNLTYITPIFNPFIAGGPQYFSSFTPNTQGVTGSANIPFTIGDLSFAGRVAGGRLQEIRPNSVAAMQYGPSFQSNVKETFDRAEVGINFTLPAFSQKLTFGVTGGYDRLQRRDGTLFQYYPFDPTTQGNSAGAVAAATGVFPAGTVPTGGTYAGGSQVSWAANNIDLKRYTFNATAALPVTRGVVLSGLYNQQRYGGAYQSLGQNTDQIKTLLQGAVTYSIPNTQSAVSFQVRNQQYKDNVLSTFNLSQNREDLNFTVRF